MCIYVFLNEWWWQGKQRSLKPPKAFPTTDTCQTTLAVRQLKDLLMVSLFLPHTPVQDSMPIPSGGAALWPKPPRSQHSFSTTLARPQMCLEFGWWEHKCRQWSHLHAKTRLLVDLSWHARWSRVSTSEAWGRYRCFVSPWLLVLWDLMEGSGMVENPLLLWNK